MSSGETGCTLTPEIASFVQAGVSITLASRDDRFVPSVAKAVGCRVSDARDRITVLVFAGTASRLLRDVAHCGLVSACFTQPSTHRTLQLKGRDAVLRAVGPADVALVRRHLALFSEDLRPLGWDAQFVQAAFWHDPADLSAVQFSPDLAFQQTPGPRAGERLELPGAAG